MVSRTKDEKYKKSQRREYGGKRMITALAEEKVFLSQREEST